MFQLRTCYCAAFTDVAYIVCCPATVVHVILSRFLFVRPIDTIVEDIPDIENVTAALNNSSYGACVYECDNDVVDQQVVNFQFKNGSTCSFTMVAFTERHPARITNIYGKNGNYTGVTAYMCGVSFAYAMCLCRHVMYFFCFLFNFLYRL